MPLPGHERTALSRMRPHPRPFIPSEGHPGAAFSYHPFAFIVLPLFLMLASYNFLPLAARQRLQAFCDRHDRLIRRGYHGFIYAFVAFGVLRMLAYAASRGLGS